MIGDIACLGICIIDPETGICEGCGRGPDEVSAVAATKSARLDGAAVASHTAIVAAHQHPYPLPPQVVREAAVPCD